MAELPYVINTGKIPDYFSKIQAVGVPPKLNIQWLKAIGFSSSNDRYLGAFLKDLGFATASGEPTDVWRSYRHRGEAGKVLARTIRKAYAGLFEVYPDAHQKDEEAIRNWMRTAASSASPTTIERAVNSFRGICKLAEFDDAESGATAGVVPEPIVEANGTPIASIVNKSGLTINLNVELQLPTSATSDDYDKFFAAMRKHLIDGPAEDN